MTATLDRLRPHGHELQAASVPAAGTLVDIFWDRVGRWPDRPALREQRDGVWQSITWRDYGNIVREVAAGLVALGIEAGDRVAVLGANQPRWHQADVGILAAGATSVPSYPTGASGQVAYVLSHAGARACFVDGRDQLAKVLLRRHRLPALEHVVLFGDRPDGLDDDFLLTFDELRQLGRDRLAAEPDLLRSRAGALRPDSLATIVYTSGTTGPPKGAMLTYGNLAATIASITTVVPLGPDDRFLSFLPLSHVAERVTSHFGQIVSGGETWFARSLATVPEDLQACRPTVLFAVPRVWEKFRSAVLDGVASSSGAKHRLAEAYLAAASRRVDTIRRAQAVPLAERAVYAVLDRLVGAAIRRQMGLDHARVLVSGAAPIDPELLWWFFGIGLQIAEVYGQTEDCGPTSLNPPDRIEIGSVGPPLPGVHVRVADDGEILVRGANVCVGYYNDPAKTRELLDDDGWMHTGDLGRLDKDGYLYVTGRKKDLIVTSSGENIAPQALEAQLEGEPLLAHAVVIGDARPYLTALLALDSEAVIRWAAEHGRDADFPSLVEDPALRAEIDRSVERVNRKQSRIGQLKAWRILPRELSIGAGDLTPTLKVKRDGVTARFADLVDAMYTPAR
jgi:long-chain acyl-CoA synthetase